MPATDSVTDAPVVPLPPEAGDVDAPRFEPNDDWLRRADRPLQKAAMWRWFATRYEDPRNPETSAPQDAQGRRVYDDEDGPFRADEVLHRRFDACVPREVIDELVQGVQGEAGNEWARRGLDEFSG